MHSTESPDAAKHDFFEKNYNIIYGAIQKYQIRQRLGHVMEFEDMVQIAALALWKAVQGYDRNKAVFSTYAYRAIRNEFFCVGRTQQRMQKYNIEFTSLEDNHLTEQVDDTTVNQAGYHAIESALDSAAGRFKSTLVKGVEAIRLIANGYTYKDIARIQRVTEGCIWARVRRAKEQLLQDKEFMDAVGF